MNRNSPEFKKLRATWYSKLAKKGFKDIEYSDETLKTYSCRFFKGNFNAITYQNKEDYYRYAGQFLHSHKFESRRDRIIWELHTQAKSIRNIVKECKKKGLSAYRDIVMHTIHKLVKLMLEKQRSDVENENLSESR